MITRTATLESPPPISAQPRSVKELRDAADLLSRIRGEFCEMPGLSLTLPQASRFFGLPEQQCLQMLQELVSAGLLSRRPDGRYTVKLPAA